MYAALITRQVCQTNELQSRQLHVSKVQKYAADYVQKTFLK